MTSKTVLYSQIAALPKRFGGAHSLQERPFCDGLEPCFANGKVWF